MNKKTIKLLLTTAATVALLGFSLASNTQYQGCWRQVKNKGCEICYRRKPLNKGCGPLVPESDPCETYELTSDGRVYCFRCDSKHVLKLWELLHTDLRCEVKNTIKDCTVAIITGQAKNSPPVCYGCLNNQYILSNKRQQCVSAGSKAIKNCEQGGWIISRTPTCLKCKAPYSLGRDNQSCEAPAAPGCFANDPSRKGACLICDVLNGYYMIPGGQCMKRK